MHTRPSARTHFEALRAAASCLEDAETREVAIDLVTCLEADYDQRRLGKTALLLALEAFRGLPGTSDSIKALEAVANGGTSV